MALDEANPSRVVKNSCTSHRFFTPFHLIPCTLVVYTIYAINSYPMSKQNRNGTTKQISLYKPQIDFLRFITDKGLGNASEVIRRALDEFKTKHYPDYDKIINVEKYENQNSKIS